MTKASSDMEALEYAMGGETVEVDIELLTETVDSHDEEEEDD